MPYFHYPNPGINISKTQVHYPTISSLILHPQKIIIAWLESILDMVSQLSAEHAHVLCYKVLQYFNQYFSLRMVIMT